MSVFDVKVDGPGAATGTFVTSAEDTTLNTHCSLPQVQPPSFCRRRRNDDVCPSEATSPRRPSASRSTRRASRWSTSTADRCSTTACRPGARSRSSVVEHRPAVEVLHLDALRVERDAEGLRGDVASLWHTSSLRRRRQKEGGYARRSVVAAVAAVAAVADDDRHMHLFYSCCGSEQ